MKSVSKCVLIPSICCAMSNSDGDIGSAADLDCASCNCGGVFGRVGNLECMQQQQLDNFILSYHYC